MMRRPLPVKPGMRQPVPTPVQGGGMSRPAMPGKPDMGGMMQRPVTPGPGTTPPDGMMRRQAFKKGGMVSTKGYGCCNGGKKSCKVC